MGSRHNGSGNARRTVGARLRERLIPGIAVLMGLLLCGVASGQESAVAQAPTALPDSLLGVWHRNDDSGRLDCKAYRKITAASEITEETGGLVGALMITSQLIHGYSDYGEGSFYVIKRVMGLAGQRWDVDVLVGIDSMPEEGVEGHKDTVRLELSSGLLSITEGSVTDGPVSVRVFFRCGKVLDGMYSQQDGDSAQ